MENKICKNCNIEKDINEFNNKGRLCRICHNEYMRLRRGGSNKETYNKNIELKEQGLKLCKNCNIGKTFNEFPKTGKLCSICFNDYSNKKRKTEKYKLRIRRAKKKRYNDDNLYKLSQVTSASIRNAFKNSGYIKQSRTFEILGCSIKDFKIYLESLFENWMTLENHGKYTGNYNETWQIDHIIPISNANTPEEVIKLNHYTNLQPLCSRKNIEKTNKQNPDI